MKIMKNDITSVVIPLIILILLSELSLITVTLINQKNSQRQRTVNRETSLTVLRESYATKCLLLVPTAQRVSSTIERCDEEAKAKVDTVR